jgi:RimJ/RimL family protein N-acetyltransferase
LSGPQEVRVEAGRYLFRTLTEADASERWGEWPADPEAAYLLNAPARKLTRPEIAEYIRSFDQRSRLLLGIFDQETNKHIGIITLAIDRAASRGLGNILIGEPDYRNQGVLTTIRRQLGDFLFDTLGLQTMVGSVLAHNHVVLDWLRKQGWTIERTLKGQIKSQSGDKMLDVCLLSYSREAWEARKRQLAEKAKN